MVGQGGVPVCDIKRRDRSTPEHAVHSTGSVGGGGQRGTGLSGRVQNPSPYHPPRGVGWWSRVKKEFDDCDLLSITYWGV